MSNRLVLAMINNGTVDLAVAHHKGKAHLAIVYLGGYRGDTPWSDVLWGVSPPHDMAQHIPTFKVGDAIQLEAALNRAPEIGARDLLERLSQHKAPETVKAKAPVVAKKVEASVKVEAQASASEEQGDESESTPGRSGKPPIGLLPDAPRAWYEAARGALASLKGAQHKALSEAMAKCRAEAWRLYDEQGANAGDASDLLSAAPF